MNATPESTTPAEILPHSSPYIDKKGLARRMGISRRTVDNWLQRGLPHLKLGSRRVRFDLREVDDWFRTHCRVVRRGKLNVDSR